MSQDEQLSLMWNVGSVFTPSAPIDNAALFAGRKSQILKISSAISQRGQHAVIYGERGVGKTSLANYLFESLRKMTHIKVVRVNCEEITSYSSLWHSIFRELSIRHDSTPAGFTPETSSTEIPASVYLPAD